MKSVPLAKILLTSVTRIGFTQTSFSEEIFPLSKLSKPAQLALFQKYTRDITHDIIQLIDPKAKRLSLKVKEKFMAHKLF